MTLMQTKAELRAKLRLVRMAMKQPEVAAKSRMIVAGVESVLKALKPATVHCFEPITKLNEVDVSALGSETGIEFYTSRQSEGEWRIVSAKDGKPVSRNQTFDLIIVPMIGFDETLHRIGFGGGYYDRLLADHPQAIKVGVCYEAGRVTKIPTEPHDIAMTIIITETKAVIAV